MKSAALLILCAAAAAALPAQAGTIGAQMRTIVPEEAARAVPVNRIRRVEANIAASVPGWRGMRSCGMESRAREALELALNAWIDAQVRQNSSLRVLRSGWQASDWDSENLTSGSRRSCRGWFITAPVFVDFY